MAASRLTAITNTEFLSSNAGSSLADISGNSRDLSASGTAAYENGYDGTSNTSYNFDGTWYAYRASTFGLTNASNFTIQMRAKIDSQPGTNVRFSFCNLITNDAANSRMNVTVGYEDSGGTKRLRIRDTGGNVQTYNTTLTTGTWYDIAYVQDQTNSLMKLYFKATSDPTLIAAISAADSAGNSGNDVGIEIGSDADSGGTIPSANSRGDFSIDNFRIVSDARTQAQIESDFAEAAATNSNLLLLGVG